ncbi:MAG: single-stranded DNA-binding protein, partial [Ilumatobacteraceae bacterium]
MINRVTLVGNLGADPELKTTPQGQKVAQLRVATTESFKDRDGNRQESTEWH